MTEEAMLDKEIQDIMYVHDLKVAATVFDFTVKAMRYDDGTEIEFESIINPYKEELDRLGEDVA